MQRIPMISNIFFDLDGTLADPKDSILRSFQYALEGLGRPPIADSEVFEFIGPPLRPSFAKVLSTGNKVLVEKAVSLFRERFSREGITEYGIYPGITALLSELYRRSHNLWVVTAKPKIYADKIVRQLKLDRWIGEVFGPELDGQLDDKSKLVAHVIGHLNLVPSNIAMVGERREDIMAGKSNGTLTLAVTYGFGSQQEIADSAPDFTCQHPSDILTVLTQKKPPNPNRHTGSKTGS
jgi:phosphoglycolate phosphatase